MHSRIFAEINLLIYYYKLDMKKDKKAVVKSPQKK